MATNPLCNAGDSLVGGEEEPTCGQLSSHGTSTELVRPLDHAPQLENPCTAAKTLRSQ